MLITGLVLGTVLGYVMQRGRFCVTGMLRDIFTLKTWRGFVALLVVIAVHAVGLAALTSLGVITPEVDDFAPFAVIIGGFLFGVGIVLAGGCASGTWYRSGEGLVGSWIALLTYGLSAAAMKAGALQGINSGLREYTVPLTTIQQSLGVSTWALALPLAVLTAFLVAKFVRAEAAQPKIAQLAAKKTGLAHLLAEKPWHVYTTGAIVGVLGVIAWPLSAATGRNDGLGITTPSSDLVRFVTTGDATRINWGALLVLGILIGSYLAAKASGEFRVRVPSGTQSVRSVAGGVLMGVGAAWAGGCTVGNGMVQTSLFSYQGWVALLFIALGVGFAAKLWLKPAEPINPQDPDGYTLSPSTADATRAASAGGLAVTSAGDADLTPEPSGVESSGVLAESGDRKSPEREPVLVGTSAGDGSVADSELGVGGFATAVGLPAVSVLERPADGGPNDVSPKLRGGLRRVGERRFVLDTLGAVCPFPLIEAKAAMQQLSSGDELVIDFDCTQATDAIPRWAATDGHEVTNFEATDDAGWTITVRKG
ncbi:YeeE/YedE family protein [Corynebacterium kroppenstedtii]|uniref:Putative membrane protein n=1 Tax=Corynebacterium kroppenstedtii (strain DSM 44385 / JCM 11950 / CIP 105744 / CCUG 35717) TaxID=645127 RepID=C4LGA2_CORK4|nr:YeeE/YedE thiosulfate transporter family protein [Corynebacterium kroppenstedtii]ACR16952.1 putative membrane protein [Corynebacterium kroppenstedtii DSM 44385]QRP09764.1 YeeE/YedE family protein [Corynebacterium kroppenstedtii]